MTRCGSKKGCTPRPSHAGQAPAGLLNENMRGSRFGTEKPHSGQAWRLENASGAASAFSAEHDPRRTVAELEGRLEGFGQTLRELGSDAEPVDDGLDRVFAPRLQRRDLVEFVHRAVDAHAREALAGKFADQLRMLAFAVGDQRRQQQGGLLRVPLEHLIDHLAHALRGQIDAVDRAARQAGTRIQQAQVIVDLGDRAHRGARVVGAGLLLDGNGRREALDAVDVRLVHHGQKLARVGRQRLHVPTLTFGVQGVEGQGRLARPGQPGEHDQLLPGQIQVDALQIVGARTAHADGLHGLGFRIAVRRHSTAAILHRLARAPARWAPTPEDPRP